MNVEFRVLGEVGALAGAVPVDLGPARRRCVLAVLLVEANRPVSPDQLADRIWDDKVPPQGRNALYSYLSRLRSTFSDFPEVDIVRQHGGYQLTLDEDAVDLHRFRRLTAQARRCEDAGQALPLYEEALGLWRGEAFAGLESPWLAAARIALERERLATRLDYLDLRLSVGQHTELLDELTVLAESQPTDERVASQLMLALYRCGRSGEALAHYQRVRRLLREELGTDPDPQLRMLHQRILTEDAALAVPSRPAPARFPAPLPRQLPAPPRSFVGRARELDRLDAALEDAGETAGPVPIAVIGGTGGVGKTWLALHWAHRHAKRFPDGQLYINLRGFDPGCAPVSASVALQGFLNALQVHPSAVPEDVEAQAALFRSLVTGRRMLIVLDNARDTDHVVPLLPGTDTCAVLITSRHQLSGLVTTHGAHSMALGVLPDPEARKLLAGRAISARATAEPDSFAELLGYCAGLPLALAIVAARASTSPGLPLTALAEELRADSARLDGLDGGELAVNLRAMFSASQRALPPAAASVFALLGLIPGPDVSLPAAASLVGLPPTRTRALLRTLEGAHLLSQHVPGRYRMHDLVRLYSVEQAAETLTEQDRTTALRRLVDFVLHTAYAGERLLYPQRQAIELAAPAAGTASHTMADEATALAWFDAEYRSAVAVHELTVARGWHTAVWQLAWSLDSFHWRRGILQRTLAVWRPGLAAARQSRDPAAEAVARRCLGNACARAGYHSEALQHLREALVLTERNGDTLGQAFTHHNIALAWEQHGDYVNALAEAEKALVLYQGLADPLSEADALNAVGWYHAKVGDSQPAQAFCERALDLYQLHGDRGGQANTLDSLGYIARQTGQYERAVEFYQRSVALLHAQADTYQEADTLADLGEVHAALGEHREARAAWDTALGLYRSQHRITEAENLEKTRGCLDRLEPA